MFEIKKFASESGDSQQMKPISTFREFLVESLQQKFQLVKPVNDKLFHWSIARVGKKRKFQCIIADVSSGKPSREIWIRISAPLASAVTANIIKEKELFDMMIYEQEITTMPDEITGVSRTRKQLLVANHPQENEVVDYASMPELASLVVV